MSCHDVRHSDKTLEGGKWTLHVIVNCFSTSMDSHLTHVGRMRSRIFRGHDNCAGTAMHVLQTGKNVFN